MWRIHHKLKSQISYDNVLLLSIVIHRKVFPSWMHLSYILGPRFVRTKFSPQKNQNSETSPFKLLFHSPAFAPLQSWSRAATCWPGKYPPSGGKPHAHLCMLGHNTVTCSSKSLHDHNIFCSRYYPPTLLFFKRHDWRLELWLCKHNNPNHQV